MKRELSIFSENTEEWEDAQMSYAKFKGNLERRISLGICFEKLRENICDRDEDTRIMQRREEIGMGGLIGIYRPFWGSRKMEKKNR